MSHSSSSLRVLFSGGGSVGHLSPSVAVWERLREKEPTTRALFLCSFRTDDRAFLRTEHVRFFPVIAARWNTPMRALLFPFLFPLGVLEALGILLIFRPHIVFSKGGYVSAPVALAAWILRIPIVLHESDRVMGRANRMLLRFARHLCIGTPQKEIANSDVMTNTTLQISATGNPIRQKLLHGTRDGGRRLSGFSGKRPVLLVLGGSQGAEALNRAIWENLEALIASVDIIHLTGRGKKDDRFHHGRYRQYETVFEELEHFLAFADIVISRAGAGAIAELAALGKATIFVPLPDLAHQHQEENAHFLKMARAVIVLEQDKLQERIVPTVRSLAEDERKRNEIGQRLREFADVDAAERIANILVAETMTDV